MKLDTGLLTTDISTTPALVRAIEKIGFDGLWMSETAQDPFLPLVLAAEHSEALELGTSIAVAFPRSPTVLAQLGWDLARFSQGRFRLGLGTQVKAHVERRFGAQWDSPTKRLKEMIRGIRALWDCWQHGTKLNFRGEFFKLTLMTPFFNPGPHDYPDVPIHIAGVNPGMTQLAGELCAGFHVHPLHTTRYLREITLPNIQAGLKKSGRQRNEITLSSGIFVIPTDDEVVAAHYEFDVRRQIAFYASTPAYKAVFDLHGWGDTAVHLSQLVRRGKWSNMANSITDEMVTTFAVRGTWSELPDLVLAKYEGSLLDRVHYYIPFKPGEQDDAWRRTILGFKL